MDDIVKYNILNPIAEKNKPYVQHGLLYIPIHGNYRYFVEASQDNTFGGRTFYLLLGEKKFNHNCRICQKDGYGRIKLKLKGEIKDYVYNYCSIYGNIDFEYIESADGYDVFSIG